ncbi:MAG: hypothetical protein A07HN63_00442 [uncultured archaeon A07HN63]|nr:MAG: hypothetical protein A07HN63_00442 [uncultured archaeon A07HN63]
MQLQSRSAADAASTVEQQSTEGLFIRNYDANRAADLTVEIEDLDGNTVFDEEYHIEPLITEVVDLPLSPDAYQVTVSLDSAVSDSDVCRIGDDPTELAYVETGNGVISVVNGV